MGRIWGKGTGKAASRWMFSDIGFKAENAVGKVENKYRGNSGVQKVYPITLKSAGAEPEQNF